MILSQIVEYLHNPLRAMILAPIMYSLTVFLHCLVLLFDLNSFVTDRFGYSFRSYICTCFFIQQNQQNARLKLEVDNKKDALRLSSRAAEEVGLIRSEFEGNIEELKVQLKEVGHGLRGYGLHSTQFTILIRYAPLFSYSATRLGYR